MIKTTVHIDGMMCAMCESHVNDAVRRALPVKKVTSSHKTGETVLLTQQPPDQAALTATIEATGYRVLSITQEPYEKHGLFSRR